MAQKQRAERKLTAKDKWLIWLRSWSPTSIKNTWNTEYHRVHSNANYLINKGTDKILGGKR